MEFRQIRYFLEINKNGSFVRAASALGLTQPALSRQIGLLEREIGKELFERGARQIRLTTAGELFLEKALKLNDLWKETLASLNENTELPSGEYSISSGGTVAAFILPGIIRKIRKKYPQVSFRVREGDAHENREAVIGGEVDLGILTGPIKDRELSRHFFLTDQIVPVVSRDHHLLKTEGDKNVKRIDTGVLREEDFVLFHTTSAIRQVMEKKLRGLRPVFKPRAAMEMRSVESVIRSLEAGLGVGFLSRFALTPKLRALEIEELTAERKFYFCYRRNRPGLDRLIEEFKAAGARY